MSGNISIFSNIRPLRGMIEIGMPDGRIKEVKEFGDVIISAEILLKNVFLVYDFKHNLLFVGKLLHANKLLKFIFDKDGYSLQDLSTKRILVSGKSENDLFKLVMEKKRKEEGIKK